MTSPNRLGAITARPLGGTHLRERRRYEPGAHGHLKEIGFMVIGFVVLIVMLHMVRFCTPRVQRTLGS